jgi:hypothetical protein
MSAIFQALLKACEVSDEPKPRRRKAEPPQQAEPPKSWVEQEKEERAELEAQAYYVLLMQGHTTPGIVKYTSNIELLRIVDKYRHPNH